MKQIEMLVYFFIVLNLGMCQRPGFFLDYQLHVFQEARKHPIVVNGETKYSMMSAKHKTG
jgi:hypothetical protein